jgi:hypothetical protein
MFKFHDKENDQSVVLQSGSLSNFLVDSIEDNIGKENVLRVCVLPKFSHFLIINTFAMSKSDMSDLY